MSNPSSTSRLFSSSHFIMGLLLSALMILPNLTKADPIEKYKAYLAKKEACIDRRLKRSLTKVLSLLEHQPSQKKAAWDAFEEMCLNTIDASYARTLELTTNIPNDSDSDDDSEDEEVQLNRQKREIYDEYSERLHYKIQETKTTFLNALRLKKSVSSTGEDKGSSVKATDESKSATR